jgi:hypothetical protein
MSFLKTASFVPTTLALAFSTIRCAVPNAGPSLTPPAQIPIA